MQSIKAILISPHPPALVDEVGYGEIQNAGSTINGLLKISYILAEQKPKAVVYISPHGNMFSDAVCLLNGDFLKGDLRRFGAPKIAFEKKVCRQMLDSITKEFENDGIPYILLNNDSAKKLGGHAELDHGVLVPMYYIDKSYCNYEIIHITPAAGLSPGELLKAGKAAGKAIENTGLDTVVIASGDLSHYLLQEGPYGYRKEGELLDEEIIGAFKEERLADLLTIDKKIIERGGECGLKGFIMAYGMIKDTDVSVSVYSYEAPFGIGYMTAAILPPDSNTAMRAVAPKKKQYEDQYIRLAQAAIEKYVREGTRLNWEDYKKRCDKEFIRQAEEQKSAAFVSIHKNNSLRGCIGTITPACINLANEIIYCAIEACSADPRFYPVTKQELCELTIKVDILMPAEDIGDISRLDEKRYGVIVSKGIKRGLLLPNLDGVSSVEEQLIIAKRKAGIDENDTNVRIKRFEVIRHEE